MYFSVAFMFGSLSNSYNKIIEYVDTVIFGLITELIPLEWINYKNVLISDRFVLSI